MQGTKINGRSYKHMTLKNHHQYRGKPKKKILGARQALIRSSSSQALNSKCITWTPFFTFEYCICFSFLGIPLLLHHMERKTGPNPVVVTHFRVRLVQVGGSAIDGLYFSCPVQLITNGVWCVCVCPKIDVILECLLSSAGGY